ncbi:MAG TPA: amidase family protein [Acidimicrobiales bacterium]|nr:amidase family protein [Acidimicrobiales bacterium]
MTAAEGHVLFQPAATAAEMIRRKEISSRELTELVLDRIDAVNPKLNAVVELHRQAALREATGADAAIARGDNVGPLHGVPMTIKDAFNVAGMRTTWGNPAFKDFVADQDATVVRRLRQAGVVIAGKTNVAFMLADFAQTANELYGQTNNPWDPTRTPGGSSGGSAAALAAGLSFLEFGSDVVGSIRIPASFCGVYGLKPSVGVIPLTGFQPAGPLASPDETMYMSALGPLARSAGDLRTALRVTAGPEDPAAKAYSWALATPRHSRLEDFRVGVVLDDPGTPVSSDVGAVLSDAVDDIARAGTTVVEGWPQGIDPAQSAESFGFHVGLFFAFQQPGDDFAPLSTVIEQHRRRMAARAAWAEYFHNIDVFVCPTNFTAPFPHDSRPFDERTITTPEGERPYRDQPFWISHASLPGLPAVVAPAGRTSGGLPVGLQIAGPLYEDDTAITFAERLGEVTGGYQPPAI